MIANSRFHQLSNQDRCLLFKERAEIWHGALSSDQYCARNEWLFRHPYAKERIQSFGISASDGKIISSMDCLEVTSLFVPEKKVWLIASFFTDEAFRSSGWGSTLLERVIALDETRDFILFSTTRPSYYEKFGFRVSPCTEIERESSADPSVLNLLKRLSLNGFLEVLREYRLVQDRDLALLPDPVYLDWHFERFRFFATLAQRPVPQPEIWTFGKDFALAIEDAIESRLEVLWVSADFPEKALAAIAARLGLPRFRYWSNQASGEISSIPMFRLAKNPGHGTWMHPQLGDSW